MKSRETVYEEEFFKILDELKILFFPDKWNANLLDYSKNELLAMTFIYRNNMIII